jgi:S-layer protein (TIGR01567 family)
MDELDIRGPIVEVIDGKSYTWSSEKFSGFFYDEENCLGTETMTIRIKDGNILRDEYGIEYKTHQKPKKFKFDKWGFYYIIGFLGEENFAGYLEGSLLNEKSNGLSLLDQEKISKILIDSNEMKTIKVGESIKLKEGYEFRVGEINLDRIFVVLTKYGDQVDSKPISPDDEKLSDSTYIYKGKSDNNPVIIAIHFKNCFVGTNESVVTYDGIFQVSEDEFHDVTQGRIIDKMKIKESSNEAIILRNVEDVYLNKREDIELMGNIWLRTADQDTSNTNPLRFCIYKRILDPGSYEIHGPIATIEDGEINWDSESFPGFYNNMNDNIKTESIKFLINNNRLEETIGVEYTTYIQKESLSFEGWGNCYVISLFGKKYFTAYDTDSFLYENSDEGNLLTFDQLSQVLIDNHTDINIISGRKLALMEGYKLKIESIDFAAKKVLLELYKDGVSVDSKIVTPSENGSYEDSTYYYKKLLMDDKEFVCLALHFSNVFRGSSLGIVTEIVTIDGIWQISEDTSKLEYERSYGELKITDVDINEGFVKMNNEDVISLIAGDQDLTENIKIKVLDCDISEKNPRKFFLYKDAAIEEITRPQDSIDIPIYIKEGLPY